jgi:hypothetical protein
MIFAILTDDNKITKLMKRNLQRKKERRNLKRGHQKTRKWKITLR